MRKILINACIALICAICAFAYCEAKAIEAGDPCPNCNSPVYFRYDNIGSGAHMKVCQFCNHIFESSVNCSGGQATCQSSAQCQYCHFAYGDPDSNAHRFGIDPVWTWNGTTSASVNLTCGAIGCGATKDFDAQLTSTDFGGAGRDSGTVYTAYVDTVYDGRLSDEISVVQHQWGDTCEHIEGSSPSQHTLRCVNDNTTMAENCEMTSRSDSIATLATCTQAPTYYCKCNKCGEISDTETLPFGNMNDHEYGNWVYNIEFSTHTRTCANCPSTDTQPCDYGVTVCPNSVVCLICGGERLPARHDYRNTDIDKSNAPNTVTATFVCNRTDCSDTTEGHRI